MTAPSRGSPLAAYQTVATHGGVAAANPHRLIQMLLEGALERVAGIRLAMQRGDNADKARLVSRCVAILDELRSSLDFQAGGDIARNLDNLYDYCWRQLLKASAQNRTAELDEVTRLLNEIRSAWVAVRSGGRAP